MSEWTCTKRILSRATECLWLLILPGLGFGQTLISQQAEIVTAPRATAARPLLFPYVNAVTGWDTLITISNTSEDTSGSTPQSGTCTLYPYGTLYTSGYMETYTGGSQTTSSIAAGSQLTFSLAQGGGGITSLSGFDGYIIANCGFRLARGSETVGSAIGSLTFGAQDAQVLTLPRSTTSPQYLLFPFINSRSGFDTGIFIANTSEDPFGTEPERGSCTLYAYSSGSETTVPGCDQISNGLPGTNCFPYTYSGQFGSVLASQVLPHFQGYAIAACRFDGAAGTGVTSEIGLRNTGATEIPQAITLPRSSTDSSLLFPFVTDVGAPAFDTGITIANTTMDPFGTTNASGSCTLNFYGNSSPPPVSTGTIAAGASYTALLSTIASGFSGYMTANCTFPDAAGWAEGLSGSNLDAITVSAEVVTLPRSTAPSTLLFTRVANWPNVDTGISIANTSADPFGTTPTAGTCQISYFGQTGNGGSAPSAQTSSTIPPGVALTFTISGGNSAQGIAATPGFHGYIIADCGFPLARGLAEGFAVSPSLSIAKSHTGNFYLGQTNATYTLTVANAAGAGATSGTVTVTENPPSTLTSLSMSGTDWHCSGNTCTSSDVINPNSSYQPITVTATVSGTAGSSLTNQASVSGGGSAAASASDTATVVLPSWSISMSHAGDFSLAQYGATYTVTVTNSAAGAPTNATGVTVTENAPPGLTLLSMAGTGWSCPSGGNTCTRGDVLNPGASYASIVVTATVAGNAPATLTNAVSVSGGGAPSAASANDVTTITESPCDLTQNRNISLPDVQLLIKEALGIAAPTYTLSGNGSITVADTQTEINAVIGLGCMAPVN